MELKAEVKAIPCKSIDNPKISAEVRSFNKEFAVQLADSIKIDGLLIPIAVRPNPDAPGRYILVNGRHKLYAVKQVLKQDLIEARIFADMGDAEAALVRDAEQLWHNPLNAAQHAAALKRWHEHWQNSLPPIDGLTEAAGLNDEMLCHNDKASSRATSYPGAVRRDGRTKPDSHKESTFDERVAGATGQSPDSVRRAKTLANAFTEEQLEVFTQCGTNQTDMLWIARVKPDAARTKAINLIASGLPVEEAMKDVLGDDLPPRNNANPGAKLKTGTESKRKPATEPELSDAEWIERHCGDLIQQGADADRLKADALLLRTFSRPDFSSAINERLAAFVAIGGDTPLATLVRRLTNVSYLKEWLSYLGRLDAGTVQEVPSSEPAATPHADDNAPCFPASPGEHQSLAERELGATTSPVAPKLTEADEFDREWDRDVEPNEAGSDQDA